MEWHGHLSKVDSFDALDEEIIQCRACPRLVSWREEIAITKRKSYIDEEYWGKPVTGFGSKKPKMLIIGLAPGAHGANRTGRIFTGDSSGDWLYGSLYRIGIAKIPTSLSRNDGQALKETRITCAVRCAPPDNKPTTEERDTCSPFLLREFKLALPTTRSFVSLGKFGWDATFRTLRECGIEVKAAKFTHGAEVRFSHLGKENLVIASFHPSQQNTFTGKLTREQLDFVLQKAGRFAGIAPS